MQLMLITWMDTPITMVLASLLPINSITTLSWPMRYLIIIIILQKFLLYSILLFVLLLFV